MIHLFLVLLALQPVSAHTPHNRHHCESILSRLAKTNGIPHIRGPSVQRAAIHATTVEGIAAAIEHGGLLPSINFPRALFPNLKASENVLFMIDLTRVTTFPERDSRHIEYWDLMRFMREDRTSWPGAAVALEEYARVGAVAHAFLMALRLSIEKYHPIVMAVADIAEMRKTKDERNRRLLEEFKSELALKSDDEVTQARKIAQRRKGILVFFPSETKYRESEDMGNKMAKILISDESSFDIGEWGEIFPMSEDDRKALLKVLRNR